MILAEPGMDMTTDRINSLKSASDSLLSVFERFDNSIWESVQSLQKFDEALQRISDVWKVQIDTNLTGTKPIEGNVDQQETQKYTYKNASDAKNEAHLENGLETFQKATSAAKSIACVIERFAPGINKLKGVLEFGSKASEGILGIEKLVTIEKSGIVLDGISIAGELAAGAEGLLVALGLGLPGLLAAAAIATWVGVETVAEKKEVQRKNAEAIQTQKAMRSFSMSEAEGLDFINNIDKISKLQVRSWHINNDPRKENIKKYGADAYLIHQIDPDNYPVRDHRNILPNVDPKQLKITEDPPAIPKSYIERMQPMIHNITNVAHRLGRKGVIEEVQKINSISRIIDRKFGTNTFDLSRSAIKEALTGVVNYANKDKVVALDKSLLQDRASIRNRYSEEKESGKTININLNTPMIGNFTIHTHQMKEGLSEFRHKVEEVLLEILNSANVVQ